MGFLRFSSCVTTAFLEEVNCGSFILKDAVFWQQKTDLFDYIADCLQ